MTPLYSWYRSSIARLYALDRTVLATETLRIAMGMIWVLNLVFVVDPMNQWFDPATFASVAAGFGPTTVGGPGLADFAAAHATIFAWGLAIVTAYLAVAFLIGVSTRLACVVGTATSLGLLWTQWGMIWVMPGGTDVGAHPVYLIVYMALLVGGAGRHLSLDGRVRRVPQAHVLTARESVPASRRSRFGETVRMVGGGERELAPGSR